MYKIGALVCLQKEDSPHEFTSRVLVDINVSWNSLKQMLNPFYSSYRPS